MRVITKDLFFSNGHISHKHYGHYKEKIDLGYNSQFPFLWSPTNNKGKDYGGPKERKLFLSHFSIVGRSLMITANNEK